MNQRHGARLSARASRILVCLTLIGPGRIAQGEVFLPDDPLIVDADDRDSKKPARRRINDYWDFIENAFLHPGDKQVARALNANTLGEVPDSSWYSNRISQRAISRDELLRGPDSGDGPAPGRWTVVSGKSQGISPGFRIRDARGEEYFLKFDPIANPHMATGAEVICTKLFHALGYNVPENYLAQLDPAGLEVDSKATVENELGEKVPLTIEQVRALLTKVAREADGSVRCVASRRVAGENIGPFRFYGTRADDANDVIPHEHRRELRGYRVFCAWLNHDDSRSINTQDFYVEEDGRHFVRHYLIDFGSTLGSGSVQAQKRRAGNEYLWEARPTFKSMATFGLWLRPWVMVTYPEYPCLGRFEADFFRPEAWKPEYPNPAFDRMDDEDAFWAARQVMAFSDEDLSAVVALARLGDPAAERYLVQCLITRRDKVGRAWLQRLSPLDNFRISDGKMLYDDLAAVHGLEPERVEQQVRYYRFVNATGERFELGADAGGVSTDRTGQVDLPKAILEAAPDSYFVISFAAGTHGSDVFLRKDSDALRVVGIRRK